VGACLANLALPMLVLRASAAASLPLQREPRYLGSQSSASKGQSVNQCQQGSINQSDQQGSISQSEPIRVNLSISANKGQSVSQWQQGSICQSAPTRDNQCQQGSICQSAPTRITGGSKTQALTCTTPTLQGPWSNRATGRTPRLLG